MYTSDPDGPVLLHILCLTNDFLSAVILFVMFPSHLGTKG